MPLRLLDDSVRAYVRPDLVQAGPRPRLRTSPRSTGTLTAWRSTSTPASSSTAGLIANGKHDKVAAGKVLRAINVPL